jgi:redox-sensitive bicupin YhaK (pirin superfamily)
MRGTRKRLHGMQIWVALPTELEETEPSFTHIPAEEIPAWEREGIQMKLIAGEAFGQKSPVPVQSPLYLIELKSDKPQIFDPGDALYGESGLYILEGEVRSESYGFGPGKLLIAQNSRLCTFEMGPHTTVYLFGGEPFPEKRFIDWNFVSSRRDRLQQAKENWIEQRFSEVPGETDFVPYPSFK